ncbi:MAG: A24 family peptidase, partial [archaeon]
MLPLASFFLSFLGLLLASYTDFRSRIVPDWIPLALGVSGLALAAYESFLSSSFIPLLWTGGVMGATYVVAYVFWRLGAWAGGDVKLFTGLAALNPFNPFIVGSFLDLSFVFL